ncbi:MAG: Oligopeptide transport system permease protein OppC [Candidatus Thorarchaeota archaeon]|nr:MAG: Oligopeptide transport system permease protein OppC [Candidatus Thorarchaeota archaeon]
MTSEPEKGSWRDSTWYESLTGFWREYRRHRIGIIGLAILLIYSGVAIAAPTLATHDPAPGNKIAPTFLAPEWMAVFDPEGVVTSQVAPDPFFMNTPNVHYAGNSSHLYSHSYSPTNDATKGGHVNLTFDYTAGTRLNYTIDPYSDLPDCKDFIYVNQTFSWDYESTPSDVNITFGLSVSMTGTFAEEDIGGLMFKVYIWLVDSSGNWRRVYQSYPPYSEQYQTRRIDLNFFDLIEGWGGMIEEDGIQEDPRDELTIAIGLAPTKLFRSFQGENPWQNYTGTVTAKLQSIEVIAYGDYFGLLGTTDKGADAWSQLVYGSRISLTIGILATALSTGVGVVVGLTAGYFGGKTDEILMRVVDFLLVIPGLPLMMVLAAFLGPTIENIIVVIAILGWTGTSRLIRSQVMAEKNKAYVESARAIGASDTYIIFRHILPNVTPILFADITLGVVAAILSESGLAFLGLTDPNEPSWGRMLADAQGTGGFSNGAWWVVVFPGLMITILSLAFTFVGHTLDQVLNPRLRER